MSYEVLYNKNRRVVGRMQDDGRYIYLKDPNGKNIAIYDTSNNKSYDKDRKFIGYGNILARFIPN